MSQYKVKIGGTVRVMGGRTDSFMHRIKVWFGINPERAKYELIGDSNPKTRQELLDQMIKNSHVASDLTAIMESIHNDICRLYVRRVSKWVLRDDTMLTPEIDIAMPEVAAGMSHPAWIQKRYNDRAHAMRFWITNCDQIGANYRDASWLLKNMRFTGWAPNQPGAGPSCPATNGGPYNEFKGFCKDEPATRFRQLMTFPIEQFGVDIESLPNIDWVQPPSPLSGGASIDHVSDAKELEGELHHWERYYNQLVDQFKELHTQLDQS